VNNRTQAIICDDLGMTQYVINNDQTVRERIDNVRNKVKDKADIIEGLSVVHRVRKKKRPRYFQLQLSHSLVDFYNIYTVGNRNEHSTITCNLLT